MSVMKKKLTPKDFNPKRILGAKDDVRSLHLGVLIGQASDVTTVTSPQGEVLEGVTGKFVFRDADADVKPAASYVLWFPSGMGLDIIDAAREGAETQFAFNMGVTRAENPAGYEWTMEPLMAPAQADPLAAIAAKLAEEGKIAADVAPQLTAQVDAEPAAAKGAKAKGKAPA